MVLYFRQTQLSRQDQQDEQIQPIAASVAQTQYAVYVAFWNGGGEGFYVSEGQSFWEDVLEKKEDWHGLQFTADPYHTIEFDIFTPITENTTLYLKPSNQNALLFAVMMVLGMAFLVIELHRNHIRIKSRHDAGPT